MNYAAMARAIRDERRELWKLAGKPDWSIQFGKPRQCGWEWSMMAFMLPSSVRRLWKEFILEEEFVRHYTIISRASRAVRYYTPESSGPIDPLLRYMSNRFVADDIPHGWLYTL